MKRRITLDLPEAAVEAMNRAVNELHAQGKTDATLEAVAFQLIMAGSRLVAEEILAEQSAEPEAPEKTIGEMTAAEFHAVLEARAQGQNPEAARTKLHEAMRDSMAKIKRLTQLSGPIEITNVEDWEHFSKTVSSQFAECGAHHLAMLVGWTDEHGTTTAHHATARHDSSAN